jgi:hypothetical protein
MDIFTKSFTLVSFFQRLTQYYKVHGKQKRKGRSKVGALFYYSSLHFFLRRERVANLSPFQIPI